MARRPKDIGTDAERGVLRALLPYFPRAHRAALSGSKDIGDIHAGESDLGGGGDIIFEVKGGKQTAQISDKMLAKWMSETIVEADNADARFGFLVTQRAGFGAPRADKWWAWMDGATLATLVGGFWMPGKFSPIRMEFGTLLDLLGDNGFCPGSVIAPTVIEAPLAAAKA